VKKKGLFWNDSFFTRIIVYKRNNAMAKRKAPKKTRKTAKPTKAKTVNKQSEEHNLSHFLDKTKELLKRLRAILDIIKKEQFFLSALANGPMKKEDLVKKYKAEGLGERILFKQFENILTLGQDGIVSLVKKGRKRRHSSR
jgi:hypothetical protein